VLGLAGLHLGPYVCASSPVAVSVPSQRHMLSGMGIAQYSREHNRFPDPASALFSPHGSHDRGAFRICPSATQGWLCNVYYILCNIIWWSIYQTERAATIGTCRRAHKCGLETDYLYAHPKFHMNSS
jgi:hypothetical protein